MNKMGTLTFKNRAQVANFEYTEDIYSLTGTVRTNDEDVITAVEGGVILKTDVMRRNADSVQEGEDLKINRNGIDHSELGNLGVIVNECISSLKTK